MSKRNNSKIINGIRRKDGYLLSNKCCIKCRKVSKRLLTCNLCGNQMEDVGHNWRLPAKNDDKGWKEVENVIQHKRDLGYDALTCPTRHSGCRVPSKVKSNGELLLENIKNE